MQRVGVGSAGTFEMAGMLENCYLLDESGNLRWNRGCCGRASEDSAGL